MDQTFIQIKNCANILNGQIIIAHQKLNILFGCNGTGKSTIARAIELESNGKDLNELMPYGIDNKEIHPTIEGIKFNNVAIFNDDYVKQYVFQADTLLKDSFEILIRSKEYDDAKRIVDEKLSSLKTTITNRQEILVLQQHVKTLVNTIGVNTENKKLYRKTKAQKSILNAKGKFFDPPPELNELKPFFEDDMVSKWADWRLRGFNEFGKKGCCPYCSSNDTEKTNIINQVFEDSFDKESIEYAIAISNAIEALKNYLDSNKTKELLSLFGCKENIPVLETQLYKLGYEAYYLDNCLTSIVTFNNFSVERENISELEIKLKEMIIDSRDLDTYFITDCMKSELDLINKEIEKLLKEVGVLKGEINKCNKFIQDKVNTRKKDVNDFLKIAGYRYFFDVEVNGDNNAKAILKFILPDGNLSDLDLSKKYLSWGEKHAFALILFLFDAISKNSDLIILDDPISSFDNNKKYAIINRLFKTGERENSFYLRTVLMLTHDIEPIIDYIQVNSGKQDLTTVTASYFENNSGQINCTTIQKNSDLLSSMVFMKELAKDTKIDIAARIGCLRKFIEYQYKNPYEESNAYNILSSLIHGRNTPSYDFEGTDIMAEEQINQGITYIKDYINDFDYNSMLSQCQPDSLKERFKKEQSSYIKMLILRAYIEHNQSAREQLRKQNDVLRKYIDETNHIENDYLYTLDLRRFNIVPDHFVSEAESFLNRMEEASVDN